jgi:hypothetical protein
MSFFRFFLLTQFIAFAFLFSQSNTENTGKTLGSGPIKFKDPPHLRLVSSDSVNGKPAYDYFFFVKAKLNGIYDIDGGMYEETFNVGKVPVWSDDSQRRFWMDMHQSQVRFRGQSETEGGTYTGYMEGDFWGGNKHFRLRHMWFEFKFADVGENWDFVGHLGQDWSFFGDKDVWPNVFDWDGPSSGVWRREPELRFWFENREKLRLEFGVANPGPELYFQNSVEPALTAAQQPLPDFIAAVNKKFGFGHLRVTGIYRNLEYLNGSENFSVPGYGATLSGYVSTDSRYDNPIQFQFVAGRGIATYIVSFSGMNYDALTDGSGEMKTVPTIGGWTSYEHWLSEKWHFNLVLGFSRFKSDKVNTFVIEDPGYTATNTTIENSVDYFLANIMWDPIPSMILGVELNYGRRAVKYEGSIDIGTGIVNKIEQSRGATRISFGAFFNF